jgi:hypothetical protein
MSLPRRLPAGEKVKLQVDSLPSRAGANDDTAVSNVDAYLDDNTVPGVVFLPRACLNPVHLGGRQHDRFWPGG